MIKKTLSVAALAACGCLVQNPGFVGESAGAAGSSSTSPAGSTSSTAGEGDAGSMSSSGSGSVSEGASSESSSGGCALVPLFVDEDGDGFGAGAPVLVCEGAPGYVPQDGDCDDGVAAVNPDAVEICDRARVDEDCDGLKNEFSAMNASCDGCLLAEFGGHSYWSCPASGWDAGRTMCQTFGADLTIVGDGEENAFVFTLDQGLHLWLGARDPGGYQYAWYDGSPLSFTQWTPPNPDFSGGCVMMPIEDAGGWRDRDCADLYGVVCESP